MGVAERREREREERRTQIIDAAERVFEQRGVFEATMADVAAEAELSKGTLYLYFSGKDALFLAIATRSLSLMVQRVEAALPAEPSGLLAVRRMLAIQRAVVREFPMRFQVVIAWVASGFHADPDDDAFADYQRLTTAMIALVHAAIERGQGDGSIRPTLDPMQTCMHLWGSQLGMWALYFSRGAAASRLGRPFDFETMVDSFAETFLRGLGAEREAG